MSRRRDLALPRRPPPYDPFRRFYWSRRLTDGYLVWCCCMTLPSDYRQTICSSSRFFVAFTPQQEVDRSMLAFIARQARNKVRADVRRIEAERAAKLHSLIGDFDANA